MRFKDVRTTIGGAMDALGKTLMGIGIMVPKDSSNIDFLKWVAIAGFFISAIGGFCGHLFAADSKDVSNLQTDVEVNREAIISGDTSTLTKRPGGD